MANDAPSDLVQDPEVHLVNDLERYHRACVTGVVWQILSSAGVDVSDLSAYASSFTLTMLGTEHRLVLGDL